MSYQVIARKYRPQRFRDVVGQEHVTQTLSNAITQNRIAHAYLFCGPRGTGKTTIARIFAKCLNCTGGPKTDFDDDDPRCQEITEGRALDVLEIDGASNRGIEEVRELRETVKYAPATSRFKIYIIDEVHMLTKEAFNALLKTLEEPPAHVKFMFATTEPEKVLPTILSRCQRFDLRRIPSAAIVQHLASIARQENVQIAEPALAAIARGADGGMRDAESTLDQLISFCGSRIEEADVLSMFGLAGHSQLVDLSNAILDGAISLGLERLDELSRQGKDLGRLIADLLHHFRNILVYQSSGGNLELLDVSEVEVAVIQAQAARIDSQAVVRVLETLAAAESRLRDASSRRILVEIALVKAIEARQAVSIESLLRILAELRSNNPATPALAPQPSPPAQASSPARPRRAQSAAPSAPTQTEPPIPDPATDSSPPPPAPPVAPQPASDLNKLWADLVEAAGRASPFLRSYLIEAHPVSLVDRVLTIGFDPEFADHRGLVDTSKNHTLLQTKLHELGHHQMIVRFVIADSPPVHTPPPATQNPDPTPPATPMAAAQPPGSPTPPTRPQPSGAPPRPSPAPPPVNKDEFKNDPLIKQALDLFKGQIVDVRS